MCWCMALFSRYLPWPFFLSGAVLVVIVVVVVIASIALIVHILCGVAVFMCAVLLGMLIIAMAPATLQDAQVAPQIGTSAMQNKFS